MRNENIKIKIIEVLQEIQEITGLECPEIKTSTKPVEALPKFDSKIWPVATCLIAEKLDIIIPNDVNIFCEDGNDNPLSIDQITEKLLQFIEPKQITNLKSKEIAI